MINEKKFEIFKDYSNYYNFETYIDIYVQNNNFYQEYSFLFRKLIENKLIEKISHKYFADYLLKLNFIKEAHYLIFIEKRNWSTLRKSTTLDRESNFCKIFVIK